MARPLLGPPPMRAQMRAARLAPDRSAPICVEGRNCWRLAPASRLAFLIDADAYFRAFAEAVARARECVLIVGWDIQAATRLQAGAMPNGWPATLREFLNTALAERPGLRAYLLDWDYSLLFAFERELLPALQLGWRSHRRLSFRLDGEHPLTASHHQKIVVVDDAVAFVGGCDLTVHRWDRPAHVVDDPDRVRPGGVRYPPFHDVQVAVSGEAARALATLARERWWRATGQRLRPVRGAADPWPPSVRPDLRDVEVAIARTEPAFDGRPGVREVAQLYLDAIGAARRAIYVENQYLTSPLIADALAARLAEEAGPDIVLVVPLTCSGWLEESTMGVLRARVLDQLRRADRHGRLRVYHPRLPGDGTATLNVHSKVMVVDDVLARVASSNLSSRSLGLDTECDLAVEARGDPAVAAAVAGLRDRLLAEHLGVAPAAVAQAIAAAGSLARAVDGLRGGQRTLEPLPEEPVTWLADGLASLPPADLEEPVAHAAFLRVLPPALREPALRTAVRVWVVLAAIVLIGLAWARWDVGAWFAPLQAAPQAALPAVVVVFVAGSAVLVPVSALATVIVLVFGPWPGAAYALAGALAAAAAGYGAGRVLPRGIFRRIVGPHLPRLGRRLARPRTAVLAALRLLPVAPFAVVNLAAGALHVRLAPFLLGSALGLAPGIAAIAGLAWLLTAW